MKVTGFNLVLSTMVIVMGLSIIYATASSVIEKVSIKMVDHVTKGLINVESFVADRKVRTGFNNYLNMTEQLMNKNYPFTEEGFADFRNDRDTLIRKQNEYVMFADGALRSYLREHED